MIGHTISEKLRLRFNENHGACYGKALPQTWVDFANKCQIRSGAKVVNFNPYEYQQLLVSLIEQHHSTVIAKTRQLGITETIGNYFLFKASRNPGYLAVIFSKTQSDTSNIAKRIRRQIDSLYEYLGTETDSLTDIQIKGGGRILFRNSTPNGARGLESVSDILYIEVNSSGQVYYEQLSSQYLNTSFEAVLTTGSSKPMMINKLTLALERKLLVYPNDKKVIEEFLSFRQNGQRLEAIEGKHDDIIMSLAFATVVLPL